MTIKYEISYDLTNRLYYTLSVKKSEQDIDDLLLSKTGKLVLLPSIIHAEVINYEGEVLAYDSGIVIVNCFVKKEYPNILLPALEDEMKRELLEYIANMRNNYDQAYNDLEEKLLG